MLAMALLIILQVEFERDTFFNFKFGGFLRITAIKVKKVKSPPVSKSVSKTTIKNNKDYYSKRKNEYLRLKKILSHLVFKKDYVLNVWDCSNRSAALAWYLKNKGFKVKIASNYEHAWVIVKLNDGRIIPIEAANSDNIPVIKENDPYYFKWIKLYDPFPPSHKSQNWYFPLILKKSLCLRGKLS